MGLLVCFGLQAMGQHLVDGRERFRLLELVSEPKWLLKLAVVQAPASSTQDKAARQASAQKRRKQRKQSLVEGLAVGGDSPYKKDRPGRSSERQLPARGGGAEGTASGATSEVAPLPVARQITQGALDAAKAAARGGPSAPQEHDYNAPENQLENYLGGGALEDLEA